MANICNKRLLLLSTTTKQTLAIKTPSILGSLFQKININLFGTRNFHNTNNDYSLVYKDLEQILKKSTQLDDDKNLKPVISKTKSILENVAQDASSYPPKVPDICIIPTSVNQISECVSYCYKNDIPIVPVGARTGLEGGIHAMKGGVSFDLTQMKKIKQLNINDLDCEVESGLNWRELNDQIKSSGLWFPVDPGASASLGGMSATSASGTNAVKFGTMRENVLGLEMIVGPNGSLINTSGKKTRSKKTSAGINLTNLFVGSEGTLGIITSIRLRLHPLPAHLAVATVAFPSANCATDSVIQVMQCGLPIARIEFLDEAAVNACYKDNSQLSNLVPDKPMLFVELQSLNENDLNEQINLLRDIFESNEAINFKWSSKQEERTQLWKARHNLHWSVLKTKPGFAAIDTDLCVPISKFTEMVSMTKDLIRKYQMDAPLMGHSGDGNCHTEILYDPKNIDQFNKAKELANEMGKVAIKLDGTVTGEHGVGRGKMDLIEEQFDEETLNVMYMIKKTLDPKNLFNPDKIFKSSILENSCFKKV